MERITREQAEQMTALGVDVYEFGFPKQTYVDIYVQQFGDFGEVYYTTKTYLLKTSDMRVQDLKTGQTVKYENGGFYCGTIVSMNNGQLTVISGRSSDKGHKDEMELWEAGYSVGDCIRQEQVIAILEG